MPIYEMIETIILSFLRTHLSVGAFGTVSADNGTYTVQTAGRTFTVKTNTIGWEVTCGNFTGIDPDLLEAARLAVAV